MDNLSRGVARLLTISLVLGAGLFAGSFVQTNLVSDLPGAAYMDSNLKNPWGMSFGPTTPFWVSDQMTGVSTLYSTTSMPVGQPVPLVVSIPPSASGPQGPTGQVFNGTAGFEVNPGHAALFIFSTLGGTVAAWNPMVDLTHAVTMFTSTDGAVYTGLATANNMLYAADFAHRKIDVLDSSFHLTSVSGGFTDSNLPADYAPYGIEAIGSKIYVQFAKVDPITHRASQDPNQGVVDAFDVNGNLLQRLVTDTHLSSPWGIAMAPTGFGNFGGDLLVGNFGSGTISAFDPTTGAFRGTITGPGGTPLVNDGLWALKFRDPAAGVNPKALFFTAGIDNEQHGLFGSIQTPEPGSLSLVGLAMGALIVLRSNRRRWRGC